MKSISVFLIAALLIVGIVGCEGEGEGEIASYDLTISSTTGGSVTTPGEGTFTYDEGTVVNLLAEADECYRFANWTDDVYTIGNITVAVTTIAMNGDYSVTANFEEEVVAFPDPNLEAAIREAIDKPTGDICPSDFEGYNVLGAYNSDITDLTGLEYWTNLSSVHLSGNEISDISPLADLTELWDLQLARNQLEDISPLAKGNFANLFYLDLSGNQISDFSPLANLTDLIRLRLVASNISDMSALADIASLADLPGLELGENEISDISPIVNFASLRTLSLPYNEISDITDLSELTELRTLYLEDNQISDLTPLSGLIRLGDPGWSSGSVHAGQLISLGLENNQITDVSPLVSNEGLSEGDGIDLRGNPLSEDSLNTHIPELEARGVTVLFDP